MKKIKCLTSGKQLVDTEVADSQQESIGEGNCKNEDGKKMLEPCTIGILCKLECHVPSKHYWGNSELKLISEFSDQQQILLSRHLGLEFTEASKICKYHEAIKKLVAILL